MFLTAASCPGKDFYTPHPHPLPPKNATYYRTAHQFNMDNVSKLIWDFQNTKWQNPSL